MPVQVPNFTNPMLSRVAQGDMSILDEEHDFTLIERQDYRDWKALIVASAKGYLNLVNRLLEVFEVREDATSWDNGALRLVAANGHLKVVNRLLEIDAVRVRATARDNWALRWAAHHGHLDVVNRLLEIDAVRVRATAGDNLALKWAAEYGHLDVVNRLLEIDAVRANAVAVDNEALILAAENGHLEVVNRFLEIDEVRANAAAQDSYALRWAARKGHLEVVNRLLEVDVVRENAAAMDNEALRQAAERGHSEVVHALAKVQWPLGKQDMPEAMQQYLPMIKAGAQLYTAKREQERILISALEKRRVVSTKRLYAPSPSRFDPRAHRLFTLRRVEVDSIANYVGYKRQYLADQIRKDDWQNKWNVMRRSERLYGLFTETNKIRREEQRALVVYKPQ